MHNYTKHNYLSLELAPFSGLVTAPSAVCTNLKATLPNPGRSNSDCSAAALVWLNFRSDSFPRRPETIGGRGASLQAATTELA